MGNKTCMTQMRHPRRYRGVTDGCAGCRRRNVDDRRLPTSKEGFIHIAMIRQMLRRLAWAFLSLCVLSNILKEPDPFSRSQLLPLPQLLDILVTGEVKEQNHKLC